MVLSQLPASSAKMCMGKSLQCRFLLPVSPPDFVLAEQVELDFADVFGPLPLQPSNDLNDGQCRSMNLSPDMSELSHDEPEVIYNWSHSLVGSSVCVSQSQKPIGFTIQETENSLELVEHVISRTNIEDEELSQDAHGIDYTYVEVQTVCLEDFEVMKVVGQGAFGKVFQVRKRGTVEIYAMKVMRKDKIMEKNHAEYMKAERDILTKIDHPFIVRLRYSFQTKYRLYLVLDFVNGGHLFFQLYHHGLFREDLARVHTTEIVSAVCHLHESGIMHRDLKPENILVDADGHIKLLVRHSTIYMSPEIILGKGHDMTADWWSIGILFFEMLTGRILRLPFVFLLQPPFVGGNREKTQQKILKDKLKLPSFLSSEAHSLLKGFLQKDPSKRLGIGPKGSNEIKGHRWFKSINWKKLEAREIQPSFCPQVDGKHCIANFDKRWTEMPLSDSPVLSPNIDGNIFQGFTYVRPAATFSQRNSPLC